MKILNVTFQLGNGGDEMYARYAVTLEHEQYGKMTLFASDKYDLLREVAKVRSQLAYFDRPDRAAARQDLFTLVGQEI
jgi:hypothetical protein